MVGLRDHSILIVYDEEGEGSHIRATCSKIWAGGGFSATNVNVR
jgi:hypothetical protein